MRYPALLCAILLPMLIDANAQAASRATVTASLNLTALQPGQQAVIAVVLDVKEGFHAQSHTPKGEGSIASEVIVSQTPGITTFAPIYPPGTDEFYPNLGELNVYTGQTIIYVPLQVSSSAAPAPIKISGKLTYQICDDKVCYAPETTPFDVETKLVGAGESVQANQPELFAKFDPKVFSRLQPAAPQGQKVSIFGRDLDQAPILFIFFAAFVIGIIFNVMPCVLPVVPLKAMGFYEVSQHHRLKCLLFGIVFSIGLIASFAALGLFVVVWKRIAWGELFANGYFLACLVGLLGVLAASTFGAFSVGLPSWLYNITPRHDTYAGNFLFGILTAVLSTPCTFGMFLGLMIWAVRQPAALGMALMITVGAGMAFPYLILSAFPSLARKLPRSGPWAELVKQMMGFLLLASAVYFARRFIVQAVGDKAFWWTLFAVVLAAGIFLIARTIKFARSKLGPAVAFALAILLIAPTFLFAWRLTHPPIDWQPYTEEALTSARQSGKPVMVEFTAAWCGNCVALETSVFHEKRLVETIKQLGVTTLRADLTRDDAPGWKLLGMISPIKAVPLTAVYGATSDEPKKLSGIYSTDDLVTALREAAGASAQRADASP